jgi:diguanylate cyclase (GGDEF)-like protein
MATGRAQRDAEDNVAVLHAIARNEMLGALGLSFVYAALAHDDIAQNTLLAWLIVSWVVAGALYAVTRTASIHHRLDAAALPWRVRGTHLATGTVWGSLFFITTETVRNSEPPLLELCVVFALSAGALGGAGFPRLSRDILVPAWTLAAVANLAHGQIVVALGSMVFLAILIHDLGLSQQQLNELRDLRHRADEAAHDAQVIAETDALTGLINRVGLERACADLSMSGGTEVLAVFVDLDGFKEINDTYGHHVGDEVLRIAARRLRSAVRTCDVVARLGGDEFFLLLSDATTGRRLATIPAAIEAKISEPMKIRDHTVVATASIGTSWSTIQEFRLDEAYTAADSHMYRNKRARRALRPTAESDNLATPTATRCACGTPDPLDRIGTFEVRS